MRRRLMNLYKKWILYRYREVGLVYGDMLSYSFMGRADGMDSVEKKFKKLEIIKYHGSKRNSRLRQHNSDGVGPIIISRNYTTSTFRQRNSWSKRNGMDE